MKRPGTLCRRRRQRGATAVEFAIVFPLFFLIFYAIVTFGMVFVIQQSLTFAVSEGARAGLNYAPGLGGDLTSCATASSSATRTQNACNTTLGALGWLGSDAQHLSVAVKTTACSDGSSGSTNCLTVTASYSPLAWLATMPFVGKVLNGPLTSSAVVQIPQSML
ncbi:TadE/TadG family type IV pilus assembly protein [Burkholderia multivorans]|jgi:Flp pilus assembly protein TadG|uniref:TadE/TadG family type IV pilus assembly protein n=1 Tax=Burkholderia multivorans TaxID=87883 RepID=UPI00057EFDB2|nr:TadE/TadG family type IV pilus assembly protein [Burkholderia multivorans]KHS14345.1 pilus assembly protein TadE [Burkholderia multivorans]KHS17430.1 pilus assembly protein TadE [Burkholderia multivorans]MBR7922463.1 pilus assembly protein [Burkholderia multivorans]MBR8106061.1 pilus assembly protein [Burkholderia multivorans]MBR8340627.1 pilus assembly protein [Burkholderia multivorans]